MPFAGWPSGVPLRVLLAYSAASCMGQYLLSTVAMSLGLSSGIAAFVMQAQVSPAAPAQPATNLKPVDAIENPSNEPSGTR